MTAQRVDILRVQDASKRFGGVEANRQISLHVQPGEIVGLIGPNGSGKTVLFKSISGYHPLDSGCIRFDDQDITGFGIGRISRLGLVRNFQQTQVFSRMSCLENMRVCLADHRQKPADMFRDYGATVDRRALELLDFAGLYDKRDERAGELSFGQQKALELAMGLMAEPKLLLLDEPTAGINPVLINTMIDRLRRANTELGVTLLVIEHNMPVIMDLAERIYCLAHGELLGEGTPVEIQQNEAVLEAYLGAR